MILPLMSLLTNLHHKVPALICENTKSTTLCSRDGERMISGILPSATSLSRSTRKTGKDPQEPRTGHLNLSSPASEGPHPMAPREGLSEYKQTTRMWVQTVSSLTVSSREDLEQRKKKRGQIGELRDLYFLPFPISHHQRQDICRKLTYLKSSSYQI